MAKTTVRQRDGGFIRALYGASELQDSSCDLVKELRRSLQRTAWHWFGQRVM